ncbi:extracellular solute-binding protein [Streptomyces sp. Z26]|uniref:ABC transporter substrate-binding protein n=1 Tax=Streptomyces sp. Z26 TaxID=2500177 RepID=UPI000EF152A9|nr:extracellular solute-binding protein [Streptomyces sp. Z26]RLL69634.1 extracellular solute-binding protein [Streptomyces sp. Z26]
MTLRVPRAARAATAALAAGLLVSACGVGAEPVRNPKLSDGKVTLTMNWWGAGERNERTLKAVELFEKEHPNIDVKPVYADWNGYWDRLATSTASGDMPDVNQFDEVYLASYADRGALLDLSTVTRYLDTSELDAKILDSGRVGDTLYAVPVGAAPNAILLNTSLFEKYGVEVPDTSDWTWEEFDAAAQRMSKASKGEVRGVAPWGGDAFTLNVWARQHGDELFDRDGELTLDPATLASYWQRTMDQVRSGAAAPPEHHLEMQGVPLDQMDVTTGKAAMGFIPGGQFTAFQQASPDDEYAVANWPTDSRTKKGFQYLKPTMYWSGASTSAHPAEAAVLIDFLTNDTRVAKILGLDRGEPANPAGREAVRPTLDESGKKALAFTEAAARYLGRPAPITPNGASDLQTVEVRYYQQLLSGETSPKKAAEDFLAEVGDAINAAG